MLDQVIEKKFVLNGTVYYISPAHEKKKSKETKNGDICKYFFDNVNHEKSFSREDSIQPQKDKRDKKSAILCMER